MGFNMQHIPNEQREVSEEAKKLYMYGAAYFLLGVGFGVLAIILFIHHIPVAVVAMIGCWVALHHAGKNLREGDIQDKADRGE